MQFVTDAIKSGSDADPPANPVGAAKDIVRPEPRSGLDAQQSARDIEGGGPGQGYLEEFASDEILVNFSG